MMHPHTSLCLHFEISNPCYSHIQSCISRSIKSCDYSPLHIIHFHDNYKKGDKHFNANGLTHRVIIIISYYYSGPSEGSPTNTIGFIIIFVVVVAVVVWSRNEERMRIMKK